MSDTSFLLDGDAPRLASAPAPQRVENESDAAPIAQPSVLNTPLPAPDSGSTPTLSVISPVLTDPTKGPSLPSSFAAVPAPPAVAASATTETVGPEDDLESVPTAASTPQHAMAHLMPQQSAASEASRRAAEIRAVKKKKAKKIKIYTAIGALVFTAVVGPPLARWFVNALNEAGDTSQPGEDPVPVDAPIVETPAPAAQP